MAGSGVHSYHPVLNASSGTGYVTTVGGLNSYVSGSHLVPWAIVLMSDIYAPDLLDDDPFDDNDVDRPLDVWLQDHPPENVSADVKPVIQDLKRRGFSRIGIAGFCWSGIKAPIAIYGGQNDTMTPPSRIIEIERFLRDARPKVTYEVKIFPNVEHGWTLLYDPNDPKAVKAADKAHRMMINWFDKHVKN
ncbi:uncharacterized protein HKW66_Vig0019630 [Vigna angularis]|uniref:Dienelactone hydrolase domain-containing protein n=1 Tax=Phaseolus angularis TaxID=3914 RepID=A0A8T0L6F0_PHAAN|nr:uncharacterized protein HKW66_Vig0019630 [Vigna angularis]